MIVTIKDITQYCRECTPEPSIGNNCIQEAELVDVIPQIGAELFIQLDEYQKTLQDFDKQLKDLDVKIRDVDSAIARLEDRHNHQQVDDDVYTEEMAQLEDQKTELMTESGYLAEQKAEAKNEDFEFILEGGVWTSDCKGTMIVTGLRKIESYYSASRIARSGNEIMTRYGLVNKQDADSMTASQTKISNYASYLKSLADTLIVNLKVYLRDKGLLCDCAKGGTIAPTIKAYKIG